MSLVYVGLERDKDPSATAASVRVQRDKDPSATAALLRIIHCFAVCTYRARPVLTPSFMYVPCPSHTLFRILPSSRMTYGFGDKPQYVKWVIIKKNPSCILSCHLHRTGIEVRLLSLSFLFLSLALYLSLSLSLSDSSTKLIDVVVRACTDSNYFVIATRSLATEAAEFRLEVHLEAVIACIRIRVIHVRWLAARWTYESASLRHSSGDVLAVRAHNKPERLSRQSFGRP